ncbi:hypothetical protein [Spirosoma luteum]|uniref:hypothetical protein n=1 Tax=Spirosoma luteum TaxID=431553 RepID=UPI000368BE2F|nr:hypothetical protein [Spirosoma luteum]
MKTLFLFLIILPASVWAQTEPLKPIETTSEPTYQYFHHGNGYGLSQRYIYDGIEVRRAPDLAPYIEASGDKNAIQEFQQYVRQRRLRTIMLVVGGSTMLLGGIITTRLGASQTLTGPLTATSLGAFTNEARKTHTTALLTAGVGFAIAAIGALALHPDFHLRRSIQYYNRSLKQQGVSWQVMPYSSISHSGIGLMAQF